MENCSLTEIRALTNIALGMRRQLTSLRQIVPSPAPKGASKIIKNSSLFTNNQPND